MATRDEFDVVLVGTLSCYAIVIIDRRSDTVIRDHKIVAADAYQALLLVVTAEPLTIEEATAAYVKVSHLFHIV